MAEVFQEMRCTECKIYMGFHIEHDFSGVIDVICGICAHCHVRNVKNGRIVEEGRWNGLPNFEIEVLRSQCYPEPRIEAMRKAQQRTTTRDGFVGEEEELVRPLTMAEEAAKAIIMESWVDRFGGKS